MSAWLDFAEEIKTRLQRLVVVGDIPVIVDRQKSISTMVDEAVGKAEGLCIVILYTGGGVENDSDPMVTDPVYQIRIYSVPVIFEGDEAAIPADDILEAILPALSGWHPLERAHTEDRCKITSDPDILPDKTYLIYEFSVTARVTLPVPEFKPVTP